MANSEKAQTCADMIAKIIELKKESFNLRMQLGAGQSVKVHRFKLIRRNIARLKTMLHQAKDRG